MLPQTPMREKCYAKKLWYTWNCLQDVNEPKYDILNLLIVSINFTK